MIVSSFLTLWAYLYSPIYDGDLWFHLLYGRYMIEHHTLVPDHSIYTWTPTNNTIYCAWIGQMVYYLIYKFTGDTGIIVLRYFSSSVLFVALFYLARQRNTLYNPIIWFSATLCILIIMPGVLDKPEVLSFALMTILVFNWYIIKQLRKDALFRIYLFPLLILIWVNTHGVFFFGCIFLFCVGMGESINQIFYKQNSLPRMVYFHLCVALFLSAGATFVTPYGYTYIQQLIVSLFDKQLANHYKFVLAYAKTFDINGPHLLLFAYTAVGLLALVFIPSLRKKQLDFVPIISNLVFAFIFTRYARTTYLWAPVFCLCVAYYAAGITITHHLRKILFVVGFAITSFILSGWILYQESIYPTKERWLDFGLCEFAVIDDEISFIKENYPDARIGNTIDHGTYMLWEMWPKTKVMIDNRYFPFQNWFDEYLIFLMGQNVEEFIQKYPFDVIEIKHSAVHLLKWFYKAKDWKLAFYGKGAAVFVRSTLPHPDKTIRGKSLTNILAYGYALDVFTTALQIKDWQGVDIILATMKRNFTKDHQNQRIACLELNKLAAQMYEKKNYSASFRLLEKAIEKKVIHQDLYAAVLLGKALEEWQEGKKDNALQYASKSFSTNKSFEAYYNVALMAWQMETTKRETHSNATPLIGDERKTAIKWRESFENILDNKTLVPAQYLQFAENADNIIQGKGNINNELIEPDPDW
jgi:hypothetical protein